MPNLAPFKPSVCLIQCTTIDVQIVPEAIEPMFSMRSADNMVFVYMLYGGVVAA